MPFFVTNWILTKSKVISNSCAIFTRPPQAVKKAPKFKISLEFGRIQIVPKTASLGAMLGSTLNFQNREQCSYFDF